MAQYSDFLIKKSVVFITPGGFYTTFVKNTFTMDKQIVNELEEMFSFAPPSSIRRSINQVFYSYLIHKQTLPFDFERIAEDFYFLTDFLEKADECYKRSKSNSV
jgi:hypothetical protein